MGGKPDGKKINKNSILIVDDESMNIIALTDIFSPEYVVYASSGGTDAVEAAEEFLPDVILLDIIMPETDGYEIFFMLKNSEKTKNIPVIFVTGIATIGDEQKGLALGAADYIIKPFKPELVKLRVRNQIKIVNYIRALDERLGQQELLTRIQNRFLRDDNPVSLFPETLRTIGEFMNTDAVLMYELDEESDSLVCRSEWLKPGIKLRSHINDKIKFGKKTQSAVNALLGSGTNGEKSVCYHSDSPVYRNLLQVDETLKDYIITLICVKGKMRAALVFSREDFNTEWRSGEKNLAVMTAGIFSGVFEREAMERQFSIVENSPDLNIYISSDAVVEYVNPAVLPVTGYTKSDIVSKGLGLIFDERTLANIKDKYIPVAMRGEELLFETDIICKNAEKRVLEISVVKTGKNNLALIAKDLTEIRTLEEGLVTAKELAERGSRAKSEFLSRMSHEMRTPLNIIIGYEQIIRMQDISESVKENCAKINSAAHTLLSMIDDVLDMSVMEQGVFSLFEASFDTGDMFRLIIQIAEYNTSLKRQTFKYNIDSKIPGRLTGDEKHLKQVIANLMANAVKFTPENGEIYFSARMAGENNKSATLEIEISDNGIGISKENQETLFEMLEQADGSITRKHGGIGVGLALAKRIIQMMDGDIKVESEPGMGAKFTFTCKLKK
ncbi:MAG: ATP-binding protein [Oscillospiraceae bacterium]|nr:ATP-binding protein [Oscillospiraceae bacterium]